MLRGLGKYRWRTYALLATHGGGQVGMLVIGPQVKSGFQSTTVHPSFGTLEIGRPLFPIQNPTLGPPFGVENACQRRQQ